MFDLRIVFTGICTFVPRKDLGRMFVLLPPAHHHVASLSFDSKHDAAAPGNGSGGKTFETLERFRLELPELRKKPDLRLGMCRTIANTTVFARRRVVRDCHKKNPPKDRIRSWISLRDGHIADCITSSIQNTCWDMLGKDGQPLGTRPLTFGVLWIVPGIELPELKLKLGRMRLLGLNKSLRTLRPITDSTGTHITLYVKNVPHNEPNDVQIGDPAPHFSEHYLLMNTQQKPVPLLSAYKFPDDPQHHVHDMGRYRSVFGEMHTTSPASSAYTCMVAGACPCPEEEEPCPEPDPPPGPDDPDPCSTG